MPPGMVTRQACFGRFLSQRAVTFLSSLSYQQWHVAACWEEITISVWQAWRLRVASIGVTCLSPAAFPPSTIQAYILKQTAAILSLFQLPSPPRIPMKAKHETSIIKRQNNMAGGVSPGGMALHFGIGNREKHHQKQAFTISFPYTPDCSRAATTIF